MSTVPGAESATPPGVWVLTSKKIGDNAQILSIADALGWPYIAKRLEFTGLNHFHFRFFGPSLRKVNIEKSSPLTPPWPDLVLTIGRRATPVALWIRQKSQNHTKLVQLGQSRVDMDRFDLVIGNPQYHLSESPNLVRLTFPLFSADTEAIAAAAAMWRPRFAHLPRPWTALLVGGSTAPFTLDVPVTQDMMKAVKRIIARDGGSVLVTTSRRTAPEVAMALEAAMPEQGFFYRWSPDGQSNPYRGILGSADRFIVTGESISMLVEVVQQGKPLAIYPLPARTTSLRLRCRQVLQRLFLPPGRRPSTTQSLREHIGDTLIRLGVMEYRRDFSLFHQQLIERRLAVWLGEPFSTTPSAPPDELPLVIRRIKALLPQSATI
ncbi:MAG: mitochondrial fission ELM1 family protein [Candidatus Binatia bacterium]